MVVCKDRLERLKQEKRMTREAVDANAAVEADVTALLSGKSYEQLTELQRKIQQKLSGEEPVEVDYWENLLKSLLVWKAKVGVLDR